MDPAINVLAEFCPASLTQTIPRYGSEINVNQDLVLTGSVAAVTLRCSGKDFTQRVGLSYI